MIVSTLLATLAALASTATATVVATVTAVAGTVLVGSITVAQVVGWGSALFAACGVVGSMLDDAKAEGEREGRINASREYEAKLRAQAKEFFTQIAKLKDEIGSLRLQRDKAQELARNACRLLGKFESCISVMKSRGYDPNDETLGYYEQLKKFTDQAA